MKNKKGKSGGIAILLILAVLGIAAYFLFFQDSGNGGTGDMVRTAVRSGNTITLTYTVSRTGKWGATVQESVSGGCTTDGKTSLKFAMLSDLPNPLVYTFTAPSSGTCTFTGDYQFGTESIKQFQDKTI